MADLYAWEDFTEDESTDAIPGKYILTITEGGEEFATIVHRVTPSHPLDGWLMWEKRRRAEQIVKALNRRDA
jgi:DNA/RNA-binding domain of Phe-tRNA-synthetase-like protein